MADRGRDSHAPIVSMTGARMRRLLTFISRRARRSCNAEDLLSEALLRSTDRAVNGAGPVSDALIVKIALNAEIDAHRRSRILPFDENAGTFLDYADPQPLQDEVAIMRDRLERINAGLNELPERTRSVLLLRRLDGLSYREIATRLGISQSAVEKHFARAIRHLTELSARC